MFGKKKKDLLRQPKIYSAPKEQLSTILPKIFKIVVIFFIVIFGLLYLFLFSPVFRIKNLELIGNFTNENQKFLDNFKGENIFLLKSKNIKEDLKKQNPQFLDIEVSRGIPSTLRIQFIERTPAIIWQTQNKFYLVDSDGFIFKEVGGDTNDLPKVLDNKNLEVKILDQIVTANFINFLIDVNLKIQNLGLKINQFQVNDTIFQVEGITDKGIKIIFDTTRQVSDQLDAFEKVYNEHKSEIKEYLDVRVEGWVYYK